VHRVAVKGSWKQADAFKVDRDYSDLSHKEVSSTGIDLNELFFGETDGQRQMFRKDEFTSLDQLMVNGYLKIRSKV
jgi:hypothetical protein